MSAVAPHLSSNLVAPLLKLNPKMSVLSSDFATPLARPALSQQQKGTPTIHRSILDSASKSTNERSVSLSGSYAVNYNAFTTTAPSKPSNYISVPVSGSHASTKQPVSASRQPLSNLSIAANRQRRSVGKESVYIRDKREFAEVTHLHSELNVGTSSIPFRLHFNSYSMSDCVLI
jgi:hypothetical protein